MVILIWCICRLWFDHLSSRLKLENCLVSGCWDNPLLIFWGRLPLMVIYIWCNCKWWFDHLSSSLELSIIQPVVAEIIHFNFFEVIFHQWSSSLDAFKPWFGHLSSSLEFRYDPTLVYTWVRVSSGPPSVPAEFNIKVVMSEH